MPIELSEVVSDAQSVRVLRRVRRRRRRRLLLVRLRSALRGMHLRLATCMLDPCARAHRRALAERRSLRGVRRRHRLVARHRLSWALRHDALVSTSLIVHLQRPQPQRKAHTIRLVQRERGSKGAHR